MKTRIVGFMFGALLLALSIPAQAQQAGKVYRIGYIRAGSGSRTINKAFRQGLRELGYVVGQNLVIESRSAKGKYERLPDLAAELVRLKVDSAASDSCCAAGNPHDPYRHERLQC